MDQNHPERQSDEVYLGLFNDQYDCHDGTGRTSWECVGWRTKRQGGTDEHGNFPVFVKKFEIEGAKDGADILARICTST